ncbi:YHYH protein [Candidatus Acetothermia bacterium]|nr:YHYH protein [Candidatus Acetothermia bacterium]MBI3644319.1 YHYH protein [Candidatus Acetothermia bacterium]
MKKITLSLLITGFTLTLLGCGLVVSSASGAALQSPASSPALNQTSNVPGYMLNAWLCQNGSAPKVDDQSTSANDKRQCSLSVLYTSTTAVVTSNGVPNHDYWSGVSPISVQTYTWYIPLNPVENKSGTYTTAPIRGPIAVAANGVAIFGPEDGNGADVVALNSGYFTPTGQAPKLGVCGAHATPDGYYHYHADGNCVHWHAASGSSLTDYSFSKVDSTQHSEIIGFAFDGYPIYGSYGYDASGKVHEMTSSYRLKANGGNGANGISDWEYVAGLGDLDQCNGIFGPTPEAPQGIYHYVSTLHNGEGKLGFSYFPLCYHGVVDSRDFQTPGAGGPPR